MASKNRVIPVADYGMGKIDCQADENYSEVQNNQSQRDLPLLFPPVALAFFTIFFLPAYTFT